jgi:hypothetical protein
LLVFFLGTRGVHGRRRANRGISEVGGRNGWRRRKGRSSRSEVGQEGKGKMEEEQRRE